MSFDDFKAEFIKENKKLKIALGLSLLLSTIGTTLILLNRRYYLYRGGQIFDERPLAEEVCRLSFLSLAEGEPNPNIVSDEIINEVKKNPFELSVEKILKLNSTELGSCKIVLKSEAKLLAFKMVLTGSDSNPFFYKLVELNELSPEEED